MISFSKQAWPIKYDKKPLMVLLNGIAELEQIVALLIAGDYQKATEAVFCGNILPRTTTSIKRHCLWPQGGDRRSSIPRRPAGNKLRLSAGQLPGNSTSRPLS